MPVLVAFRDRTSNTTAEVSTSPDIEEWIKKIGSIGTGGWQLMHDLTDNATVGWDKQSEILAEFDDSTTYCWDPVARRWVGWIMHDYNKLYR
jgi:hypothetical protein